MSKLFVYTIILFLLPDAILGNVASQLREIDPQQKVFHLPANQINFAEALSKAQEKLGDLHKDGFLDAAIDSVIEGAQQYTIYIAPGSQYYYIPENFQITPQEIAVINTQSVFGLEPLSFIEFESRSKKILTEYSRKGFPFARIEKSNVRVQDFYIYMNINIHSGETVLFDTIRITGNARLRERFLKNLLAIKAGAKYDEKLVAEASGKLLELEYIRLTGPSELRFSPGLATLFIPAQNNRANRFDGMAGISGGGENETPIQINGILRLYLSSTFGMGEYLDLSWHGPGKGTQVLNLQGGYPFPLGLPLETEAAFSLHKQDTSWIQMQFKPTVFFTINGPMQLGAFWHYRANNPIGNTSSSLPPSQQSGVVGFKSNMYGVEIKYTTRAYNSNLLQPGIFSKINTSAGIREIKSQNTLNVTPNQPFEPKKSQLNVEAIFEKRWLTGSRTTFTIKSSFAFLSGNNLPSNQLYRLGGFNSLRGFDELSLHASAYAFSNLEFRLFTSEQSFFNLFANGGWFERKAMDRYLNDLPFGTGIGLNLKTDAGIFSLILAIGTSKHIPSDFRNAKIHLGYVSSF
jgi:outer membrane protein assembly factor BamA